MENSPLVTVIGSHRHTSTSTLHLSPASLHPPRTIADTELSPGHHTKSMLQHFQGSMSSSRLHLVPMSAQHPVHEVAQHLPLTVACVQHSVQDSVSVSAQDTTTLASQDAAEVSAQDAVSALPTQLSEQHPVSLRPVPPTFAPVAVSQASDGSTIYHKQPSLGVKFISAGLAACWADLVTFPLDTAKVRLQVQGESSRVVSASGPEGVLSQAGARLKYRGLSGTVVTMAREEGLLSLYNGLIPGLQRQLCFASVNTVKHMYMDFFNAGSTGSHVSLRIMAGVTTGAASVLIAQPTDVVKVRLQAQVRGAGRYTGTWHAYKSIGSNEGVKGLWKGLWPNVARCAIVTASELVTYDLIKEAILTRSLMSDSMPCHFVSAFGAGLVTTIVASPVDVVKTRFMNSPAGLYRGTLHCAYSMLLREGPFAFYKGFVPSYLRLGSWNIVMFVTFEQFKRVIGQVIDGRSEEVIFVPNMKPALASKAVSTNQH